MAQFDVFTNPIGRARRTYPLVVILQSDLAEIGRNRITAPLAPRTRLVGSVGRFTPRVTVASVEYIVLVHELTTVLAADLRDHRGHLARYREDLVAALDYLFLGV